LERVRHRPHVAVVEVRRLLERQVGLRRPHQRRLPPQVAWTKIVRHVVVTGRASPDDPALTQYRADRRRKQPAPQQAGSWHTALRAQQGNCHLCGNQLLDTTSRPDSATQAEAWYAALRATLTLQASPARNDDRTINRLVHTRCADVTQTTGQRIRPADTEPARPHAGCLSRVKRRVSSTVLRED
jgi:hypothetical protein